MSTFTKSRQVDGGGEDEAEVGPSGDRSTTSEPAGCPGLTWDSASDTTATLEGLGSGRPCQSPRLARRLADLGLLAAFVAGACGFFFLLLLAGLFVVVSGPSSSSCSSDCPVVTRTCQKWARLSASTQQARATVCGRGRAPERGGAEEQLDGGEAGLKRVDSPASSASESSPLGPGPDGSDCPLTCTRSFWEGRATAEEETAGQRPPTPGAGQGSKAVGVFG